MIEPELATRIVDRMYNNDPMSQWLGIERIQSLGLPAVAAIVEIDFADVEQKARYQALIADLRCPMCLNSNLAGSDAPIAADLRAEIQEQILAGNSDDQILAFLVDRYGQFILYKPRLQAATALLWFAPPPLLLAGFFIMRRMLSNRRQLAAESGSLSEQEQQLMHHYDPEEQEQELVHHYGFLQKSYVA